MQYTRKQIIEYLISHQTASASDLSQALSLTLGNIRHHLRELEIGQYIQPAGTSSNKGRGRPEKLFSLSSAIIHHNLIPLSSALLNILASATSEQRKNFHKAIATEMIGKLELSGKPSQRVHQCIQWLDKNNYRSRWEASITGPRIILDHCPYFSLLQHYPEICEIDLEIVSKLLNRRFHLKNNNKHNPSWPLPCVFTPYT